MEGQNRVTRETSIVIEAPAENDQGRLVAELHLEPGAAEQMRTEIFAAATKPVESEGGSPPSGTNDTSGGASKEGDAEDDDETEA